MRIKRRERVEEYCISRKIFKLDRENSWYASDNITSINHLYLNEGYSKGCL